MSRTAPPALPPLCGGRPAPSRRARAPRPTGRSLGRFQRADNRRHHLDLGAGPDPDARSLNLHFDDAGMPIRRFALNASLRRRRSRRFDDHRRKRQAANLLFSLSTRLATPGEQLLRRPTVEPPSKLSPTIAAFCSAVQTTASRAGGNVAAAPDPQSWTLHCALKSTRVGAPKRSDYRPATPAEKGGASTVLTRRDRTSSTRRQPSGGGFRRVDLLCRCRRRNAGDRACCPACVVDPIDLLESVGAGATWRLLNTQLIVAQTVTLEGLRRPASSLRRSSLSSSRVARPSGDRRLSCPCSQVGEKAFRASTYAQKICATRPRRRCRWASPQIWGTENTSTRAHAEGLGDIDFSTVLD